MGGRGKREEGERVWRGGRREGRGQLVDAVTVAGC